MGKDHLCRAGQAGRERIHFLSSSCRTSEEEALLVVTTCHVWGEFTEVPSHCRFISVSLLPFTLFTVGARSPSRGSLHRTVQL